MNDTPVPPSLEESGLTPEDYNLTLRRWLHIDVGSPRLTPSELATFLAETRWRVWLYEGYLALNGERIHEDERNEIEATLRRLRPIAVLGGPE